MLRSRRDVLRAGAVLPFALVELAGARGNEPFTFAVLSDAHLQLTSGTDFVRSWDRGLRRAIAEVNLLSPAPDFVVFGGDLAHRGLRAELDHGAELLSALRAPVRYVIGEHDYYLDLGERWSALFGPSWYSFDHKGIHFVVLNSILTDPAWTGGPWAEPAARMEAMVRLDQPANPPFMVGESQRAWLASDLKGVRPSVPVVVLTHAPLRRFYREWNFWTEDAELVYALLRPFERVTVIHGHMHQLQYDQIGNLTFLSAMATAWPYPYPPSGAGALVSRWTVPTNRADPFFERDGTGWQFVNITSGNVDIAYNLYNNPTRSVHVSLASGRPEDSTYAASAGRTRSQDHY